jgi:hypothetical protein
LLGPVSQVIFAVILIAYPRILIGLFSELLFIIILLRIASLSSI